MDLHLLTFVDIQVTVCECLAKKHFRNSLQLEESKYMWPFVFSLPATTQLWKRWNSQNMDKRRMRPNGLSISTVRAQTTTNWTEWPSWFCLSLHSICFAPSLIRLIWINEFLCLLFFCCFGLINHHGAVLILIRVVWVGSWHGNPTQQAKVSVGDGKWWAITKQTP